MVVGSHVRFCFSNQGLLSNVVDSIREFSKSTFRQQPTRLQCKRHGENHMGTNVDNVEVEEEIEFTIYENIFCRR